MKLFQREIEPRCSYCEQGRDLGGNVICPRKGIMPPDGSCRAFRYDPFRRVPPRREKPDFGRLKDEDFII